MSSNQNLKEYNKMDSKKNQTSAVSMTEGSLWKNIFLFSCPLIFSQLLEVMFNLSDVAVVGRFADYLLLKSFFVGICSVELSSLPNLLTSSVWKKTFMYLIFL